MSALALQGLCDQWARNDPPPPLGARVPRERLHCRRPGAQGLGAVLARVVCVVRGRQFRHNDGETYRPSSRVRRVQ
eukprot:13855831-Alexandrium_andersonii.AAC.1